MGVGLVGRRRILGPILVLGLGCGRWRDGCILLLRFGYSVRCLEWLVHSRRYGRMLGATCCRAPLVGAVVFGC